MNLSLEPDELRAVLNACGVAVTAIQGPAQNARQRDFQHAVADNLGAFTSASRKLSALAKKMEQGMVRPLSDKIYVHAALTPEAHRVLHETLARRFNGKVPAGAIGTYLSDLILDDIGQDTTGDVE
jgi:hypothetical protein